MKNFNWMLTIMVGLILLLAACGNGETEKDNEDLDIADSTEEATLAYEPEDINPDVDVCEVCAMAVADEEHATQIVLENDRALKFDDLGCLYNWIEENGEEDVGAKFVRDFNTQEWIEVDEATYVFDEAIETPMSYGIISFKESSDAEAYIEEHEIGELLKAQDLASHKWEMMNHDHDHHDEHDDHDQEH